MSLPYKEGIWVSPVRRVGFRLGKCPACGTVRTTWSSTGTEVDYKEMHLYTESISLSYRHLKSIATIERFYRGRTMLDIGCNSGQVIGCLKGRHPELEVKGIDGDSRAIATAKSNGLDAETALPADVEGEFDNIIMLHTMEHVVDLKELFYNIERLSHKGTRVYIAVPNIESLRARVILERWGALNPVQHCWHFSKSSFRVLIRRFLPNARILHLGTSWVYLPRFPFSIGAHLFQGDQIEGVLEI